jgi:very-short-patch-repair endonuclease
MKKQKDIKAFNPPAYIPKDGWLYDKAEELRNNQTESEKKLAKYLDRIGVEYYPQLPVIVSKNEYIIDFAFRSKTLNRWFALEIDGGYHKDQKEKDLTRDAKLLTAGWLPIRMKNKDTNSSLKFAKLMLKYGATDIMLKIK